MEQEVQLMLTNLRDAFSGQSRSPNIVPFHMLGIVFSCAIVTLSLRGAVFTIFDFKKCHDLEIGVRSLKVIDSGTVWKIVYSFLLVFFSNIVPKTQRFLDIWLRNCRDLENQVRGPSRSLEMSPCDTAYTTFYWRSIVTMALSCVISEIFNVEKWHDLEIGVRSLKVIESGTIW